MLTSAINNSLFIDPTTKQVELEPNTSPLLVFGSLSRKLSLLFASWVSDIDI